MSAKPHDLNLCRTKQDTFPWEFTVTNSAGTALDITGASFLLTVNTEPDPEDTTNQVFQLTGTIINATGGVVRFVATGTQMDIGPDTFFYDIQMTDSGGAVRTIAKGEFQVLAQITQ